MDKNMKKGRLMAVVKILWECTDAAHPISTIHLIAMLEEQGYDVNRHTIRDDIDVLQQAGLDVVVIKSKQNLFYLGERFFQPAEIKLLIDAVAASHILSEERSETLIGKLSTLCSEHQKADVKRNIYIAGSKTGNEQVYEIIDTVNDAINTGKQISFQYIEYNSTKGRVLRNCGEVYVCSPYLMAWNDGHYYVIGYSEKHQKIVQYRVDRIVNQKILNAEALAKPEDFDAREYVDSMFRMFGGEKVEVMIECDMDMMKYVIDHFGENVFVTEAADRFFRACVTVQLSPTFYSWIFQFGGKIRLLTPQTAVDEYTALAKKALGLAEEA